MILSSCAVNSTCSIGGGGFYTICIGFNKMTEAPLKKCVWYMISSYMGMTPASSRVQWYKSPLPYTTVNNQLNLTGHDLRYDFLCILHQEVYGLASSA